MIIGITIAGPTLENRTSGSPKVGVVGGDRQVAQHDQFAAAAQHMALHRGDDRLFHQPRRHLEFELRRAGARAPWSGRCANRPSPARASRPIS